MDGLYSAVFGAERTHLPSSPDANSLRGSHMLKSCMTRPMLGRTGVQRYSPPTVAPTLKLQACESLRTECLSDSSRSALGVDLKRKGFGPYAKDHEGAASHQHSS